MAALTATQPTSSPSDIRTSHTGFGLRPRLHEKFSEVALIVLSARGSSSPRQRRLNLAGDFNPFQSRDGRQSPRVASAMPESASNSDVFKRR
jgi:hypothetical protein